jgi:hypothetical protein
MSSEQRLFNRVARHLLRQNKRSKRRVDRGAFFEVVNAYRSKDGLRCGVGSVIPNRCYTEKMEGMHIGAILRKPFVWKRKEIPPALIENQMMLQRMQELHDRTPVKKWLAALKQVAGEWALSPRALLEFE